MGIGERIDEQRTKDGLSVRQLAMKANIPYSTLYAIIKRDSNGVDAGTLKKIADALNISTFELMTGKTLQEFEDETEDELRKFEAGERERQLAIFAIKHPLFIEALTSVGISITIEKKEMYANWDEEGKSAKLTIDDLEELFGRVQSHFLWDIQDLWCIPIADKHEQSDTQQDECNTEPEE